MTEHFEVTILGSASAKPTADRNPSGQFVTVSGKCFLIDCGEGTQMQIRRMGLKLHRLNHIFISHLHGDHCLGLVGLISSIGLMRRTADLTIFAPVEAEAIFRPQLDFFCKDLPFRVHFVAVDTYKCQPIYEDRSVKVTSIPLRHRIPCCGFLFEKKAGARHLIREKIDFYNIPIAKRALIKEGADFVTDDGRVVPNEELTTAGRSAFRYAYCADTAYWEEIGERIKGVDLLYHESTFLEEDAIRAKETNHSTARQAAMIAVRAEAKRLVLGHYSSRYHSLEPLLHEARVLFPATELSKEGMRFREEE